MATRLSTVLRHLTPSWHHPRCPSFYARLNQLAGAAALRVKQEVDDAKQQIHAVGTFACIPPSVRTRLAAW
jgi:hypothetical protein